MLKSLIFSFLFFCVCSFGQAQSPSHRPTENFRPQERPKTVVLPGAQDGELTLEEYHRRRLIHEGQKNLVRNSPQLNKLDQEINSAFKSLTNPTGFIGRAQEKDNDNSALEREARLSAELDRQIERSRQERDRWEGERQPILAQAYGDENYEKELVQVRDKQQKQLKKMDEASDLSPQELREFLRTMPGARNGDDVPPEFVDTMAENLYLALTPMRQMSKGEFKKMVLKAMEGKPFVSSIDENHFSLELLADLIRDPKAIPNLGLITEDRVKLLKFFLANVALFILAIIWRRKQKKSLNGFLARMRGFIVRYLSMTALRIGVLVFFYGALFSAGFNIFLAQF